MTRLNLNRRVLILVNKSVSGFRLTHWLPSGWLLALCLLSPAWSYADPVSCEQDRLTRSLWWRETDKLLDALYDVHISRGLSPDAALADIRTWASHYPRLPTDHPNDLTRHLAIKLQFVETTYRDLKQVDIDTAQCLVRSGLATYRRQGTPQALSLVTTHPLFGQWEWAQDPQRRIVERYDYRADGMEETRTGDAIIRNMYTVLALGKPEARRWVVLTTGISRNNGEGPYNRGEFREGELTTRVYLRQLDAQTLQSCFDQAETQCFGNRTRVAPPP